MRYLANVLGLLIVAGIVLFVYKYYFSNGNTPESAALSHPAQTIDTIGVKNDLLGIAQAERIYQAQHNSYGSLDDLVSNGAMALKKTGRDGYTYDAEVSDSSFRIVAHCPSATAPSCTNYSIDQTMEIQAAH